MAAKAGRDRRLRSSEILRRRRRLDDSLKKAPPQTRNGVTPSPGAIPANQRPDSPPKPRLRPSLPPDRGKRGGCARGRLLARPWQPTRPNYQTGKCFSWGGEGTAFPLLSSHPTISQLQFPPPLPVRTDASRGKRGGDPLSSFYFSAPSSPRSSSSSFLPVLLLLVLYCYHSILCHHPYYLPYSTTTAMCSTVLLYRTYCTCRAVSPYQPPPPKKKKKNRTHHFPLLHSLLSSVTPSCVESSPRRRTAWRAGRSS